ncbi:MAG TPA: sugar ABC transporter permease [Candidatus Caccomorpha excrementavium]|nr:sugar ABC transporter permease [Candidatus Caccomorpha excrementavium]
MENALTRNKKLYKKPLWKRMWNARTSYVMIGPFMLFFLVFTVIPVVAAIALSFTDFNMLQSPNFVGLENYKSLFLNDDVFMIAVKNTLIFAFITGPLSYIACFVFAWFINELPGKLRAVMTLVFYAPSISGSAYVIWNYIFYGDRYGVVNGILMRLGILDTPIQWLTDPDYMMMTCIIVQLWLSLGTSFLAFMAGFKTVDEDLYEAGAIDGIKNRFQEVWYLTLPQMKPQLLFGAVMQIASSFAVGAVPMALNGFPSTDYATHTIITHIHDYGNVRYELGYACAISTVLLLLMLITNKVINRVLRED